MTVFATWRRWNNPYRRTICSQRRQGTSCMDCIRPMRRRTLQPPRNAAAGSFEAPHDERVLEALTELHGHHPRSHSSRRRFYRQRIPPQGAGSGSGSSPHPGRHHQGRRPHCLAGRLPLPHRSIPAVWPSVTAISSPTSSSRSSRKSPAAASPSTRSTSSTGRGTHLSAILPSPTLQARRTVPRRHV